MCYTQLLQENGRNGKRNDRNIQNRAGDGLSTAELLSVIKYPEHLQRKQKKQSRN